MSQESQPVWPQAGTMPQVLCCGQYAVGATLCRGHYTMPWAPHYTVGAMLWALRYAMGTAHCGLLLFAETQLPSQAQAYSPLCLGHRPLPVPHSPVSCHWLRATSEDEPRAPHQTEGFSSPQASQHPFSQAPDRGSLPRDQRGRYPLCRRRSQPAA